MLDGDLSSYLIDSMSVEIHRRVEVAERNYSNSNSIDDCCKKIVRNVKAPNRIDVVHAKNY